MFGIGSTELLVILVVALIVLGPKSLANVSRTLGKAMGEFRRVSTDFQRTLNAEAEEEEQRKRKQEAARAAKEAAAAAKEAHAAEMATAAAAATEAQPAATTTAQADNIPASEVVIDATATRPVADAGQNTATPTNETAQPEAPKPTVADAPVVEAAHTAEAMAALWLKPLPKQRPRQKPRKPSWPLPPWARPKPPLPLTMAARHECG